MYNVMCMCICTYIRGPPALSSAKPHTKHTHTDRHKFSFSNGWDLSSLSVCHSKCISTMGHPALKYIYIYIWYPPPHVPTPLCLNLSLREAWVRGIPLSPSLSPKSQVQDGVGVWDWGECLQIVTLFFHVWRVPSKIAPNHPNHFRIILIRARPWIQDPRSKIAHRSCAGNLGSNAQPNHPNHFRIILIRSKAQGVLPGNLRSDAHPLERFPGKTPGQSWILDLGSRAGPESK